MEKFTVKDIPLLQKEGLQGMRQTLDVRYSFPLSEGQ